MSQVPFTYISTAAAISALFYYVARSVKFIFYHDLSKYPGPPLAAATTLYRAYYDIVKDGGWLEHLFSLHEKYGMRRLLVNSRRGKPTHPFLGSVVRVGPNEVSLGLSLYTCAQLT
jgi:hypothetical protein